jgi:hypothetical protein
MNDNNDERMNNISLEDQLKKEAEDYLELKRRFKSLKWNRNNKEDVKYFYFNLKK